MWIDVLLSAGVPVEVCKVAADEPKKSLKALEKLKKRLATSESKARIADGKAKREMNSAWSGDEQAEDTEGEEDEWRYESGEEGKAEGRWERSAPSKKRLKM